MKDANIRRGIQAFISFPVMKHFTDRILRHFFGDYAEKRKIASFYLARDRPKERKENIYCAIFDNIIKPFPSRRLLYGWLD